MDIGAPENRPQLASGYKPLSQLSEARQQLTSLANVSKAQRSAENRVVKKFSLVGNDVSDYHFILHTLAIQPHVAEAFTSKAMFKGNQVRLWVAV